MSAPADKHETLLRRALPLYVALLLALLSLSLCSPWRGSRTCC